MKVRPAAVVIGLITGGITFWLFAAWWAFSAGFIVAFLMSQNEEK